MMLGEQPVHFLHIGKTGGTAIKHALQPLRETKNLALHGHRVRLSDVPPGEPVFFFLRDPLSRFVSAFYSRQRKGRPTYVVPWSPGEAAAFSHFHTPDELARGLSSAGAVERRKAERAMRNISHVNTSYWYWLVSPAYLQTRAGDILFIGLQEHLSGDFAVIRSRLGISEDARLPDNDVDAHRNPVSLDRTLGEQSARNLSAWYAADFAAMRECRRIARERGLRGAIVEACLPDAAR